MTAPTYPRIDREDLTIVWATAEIMVQCEDPYEARHIVNALNAAFNAGMRHAIDMMKEQSDEADA